MELKEYELAGIETIARGVCVRDGKLLLCRAKGGSSTYLPGGHIEFGETGRQALVREVKEELGVESSTGQFLGVVENSFLQHGKPHAEINLVYELKLGNGEQGTGNGEQGTGNGVLPSLQSQEDWIEFEWYDLNRLDEANLLPPAFRSLSAWPTVRFDA
ncbi:MAG: NUDIX domain-containing protein [Kiritimatiellae bacterium]|nr:NUDIX domain-containing protein [Kiritimatiellia bacterium]